MLQPIFSLAAVGSFCWFVTSSLWIYPHSLSYFNESIGGPLNGPEHLLGSNVDWGQDELYVLKSITDSSSTRFTETTLRIFKNDKNPKLFVMGLASSRLGDKEPEIRKRLFDLFKDGSHLTYTFRVFPSHRICFRIEK